MAFRISSKTAEELEAMGVELPPEIKVDDSEVTEADILVCADWDGRSPLMMADNLISDCGGGCGRKIQHRPHVPTAPRKLCISCAYERAHAN